ncbi:pyridoxal-phosphate dependent enzyme [Lysobacter pythonis]|uniref:Pyridoxal-phosphate dependent enzyme n=1 Tax=Solilutibacter pythonis TaxID=2483112 RepID=A0A3M2I1B7_9GAMM|nr:pyridoxal-phosphate dependent enzyme [Lysobacter pythonis]RMH93760.1 pyridoxal-phosphate dependent enzyme [Lysobacter pythonis]
MKPPLAPPVLPTFDDVLDAAARIRPHARVTPILHDPALDALAGAELHFKCENLQRGGSFKFRGACNAVSMLDEDAASRGVVTQSSGNHGAAIALACRLRGLRATVVVPEGAPRAKLDNIATHGAGIVRCAPTMAARDAATAALIERDGATLIHPFDHPGVIAGQGTAALELHTAVPGLDALLAPVGGGGLLAGSGLACRALRPNADLWGAEPEAACDAHDSLSAEYPITDRVPDTICDGLRGHLSARTFALIARDASGILLADEAGIRHAMRLLYTHLKVVVEPSSAVVLAVVLKDRQRFAGKRIGIVLSGGNVDLAGLSAMIDGD